MQKAVRGPRGERSPLVRSTAEEIVRHLQPKDYLSEILALRYWCATHVRYANDGLTTELVKDPARICEEVVARGLAVGDCDDMATLIAALGRALGREAKFGTVGFGAPQQYSHVFALLKEPKTRQWIVCDPVAGTDEAMMLRRVKTHRFWEID